LSEIIAPLYFAGIRAGATTRHGRQYYAHDNRQAFHRNALMIELDRDYWADTPKDKDPDSYSESLNKHHQTVWTKPLPNGKIFELTSEKARGYKLIYKPGKGDPLYLSSDGLGHSLFDVKNVSYADHFPHESIRKQCREVIEDFWRQQVGIAWYIIFPAFMRRGHTINQARGVNPKIYDRFDLTLECIRRYYQRDKGQNPLREALNRYKDFFDLFVDFDGYVTFFCLQDLLKKKQGSIDFWLPFDDFERSPLPQSPEEYRRYKEKVCLIFAARRERIAKSLNENRVKNG
jgi:hypothetical protein